MQDVIADAALEVQAIGAALADHETAEALTGQLGPDDFADMSNREVWRAVAAAVAAGDCNLVAVHTGIDKARGAGVNLARLVELQNACPTRENGFQAVARLKALRNRRELQAIAAHMMSSAGDQSREVEDIVAEAVRALADAAHPRCGAPALADVLPAAMDHLRRLRDGDLSAAGLSTGFVGLDPYLQLRPRELTVIGARTSVGKTAFLLCVALNAAQAGGPALFVTCEMSAQAIATRALAIHSGISTEDIRCGAVAHATWQRIEDAAAALAVLPLRIADLGHCRVSQIDHEARAMRQRQGLALICVDYLGILTAVRTSRSRTKENEIAELSGDLKALAMNLGVPMLVAAQLNRNAEGSEAPRLRDLRDSGAVEQDADNVLLLIRDRDSDDAQLAIAKQRNGRTGLVVPLTFDRPTCRFQDRVAGLEVPPDPPHENQPRGGPRPWTPYNDPRAKESGAVHGSLV